MVLVAWLFDCEKADCYENEKENERERERKEITRELFTKLKFNNSRINQ